MSSVKFQIAPLDMPQGDAQKACPPCAHCGKDAWVVDGDGRGKFWLLCALHDEPITTAPLPDSFVVVEGAAPYAAN